jgi:hypothetical protein
MPNLGSRYATGPLVGLSAMCAERTSVSFQVAGDVYFVGAWLRGESGQLRRRGASKR